MIVKMMFYLFVLLTIIALGFSSYYWGALVSVDDQLKVISEMRSTSSIVFGVLGVWVAIVYPEALTNMFKRNKNKNDTSILKFIFYSIRICTIIVLYSIVIGFALPVFRHIPLLIVHKNNLKSLNVFVVGLSSFLLFISLLFTFVPLEVASSEVEDGKKIEDELDIRNRYHQQKKR